MLLADSVSFGPETPVMGVSGPAGVKPQCFNSPQGNRSTVFGLVKRPSPHPVLVHDAVPTDLYQIAGAQRVQVIERTVPAIPEHRRYVVRADDHGLSLAWPGSPCVVPEGTVGHVGRAAVDGHAPDVQASDRQAAR